HRSQTAVHDGEAPDPGSQGLRGLRRGIWATLFGGGLVPPEGGLRDAVALLHVPVRGPLVQQPQCYLHERQVLPGDHRSDNPASVTLGVASRPGLDFGMAITNLCPRATRSASELKRAEFEAGRRVLERKIRRIRPKLVAFVGVTLYRRFFGGARRGNPGPGLKPDEIQGARVLRAPEPERVERQLPQLRLQAAMVQAARARSRGR